MMQLVDNFEEDPPFYASFMSRRIDNFKLSFTNEISSTLLKLKSGKKKIPVNLINVEGNMNINTSDISHINDSNNTSGNNAVPETSNMGQYQHQLAELNLPLGQYVQVTASVPFWLLVAQVLCQ